MRLPDGSVTTVHCPNTGALAGVLNHLPCPAVVSVSDSTSRKYPHTLEAVRPTPSQALVGIHSANANRLAHAILEKRLIPALGPYDRIHREVKVGTSRIDFLLERDGGERGETHRTYCEVKSVTLGVTRPHGELPGPASISDLPSSAAGASSDFAAVFPDTVSDRALKHVNELASLASRPHTDAVMLMIVQRADCSFFSPAWKYDLEYSRAVAEALSRGVKVLAVSVGLETRGEALEVDFLETLPLELDFCRQAAEEAAAAQLAAKKKGGSGKGTKKVGAAAAKEANAKVGVETVEDAEGPLRKRRKIQS